MSIRVMQWVWDHSESRNAQRLVLLAIADCASDDGGNAYPSNAELQRKSALTDRGVQLAIKGLVELGELKVNLNGGRRGTNMYQVIMDPRTPEKSSPPAGQRNPEDSSPPPPKNLPPSPENSSGGTVPEPSSEPSSSFADSSAPTAQTILAAFIDWLGLPAQGPVKLTNRAIGMYAKAIKELLTEGFDEKLIRLALAAMHERGLTARPTLLHSLVVEVQRVRPTSGAPKPFVQQADEYREAKREREDVVLSVMQQLMDYAEGQGEHIPASKARKIVNNWIDSGHISIDGLSVSVPSLYSGYNVIAVEAEEVS